MTYDTIIRNGRWFDGTGAPSAVRDLGIRDGHVVAVTPHELDQTDCPQVIDASGKWVLPGMLDIHTHYDVEVLNGPSLASVAAAWRHDCDALARARFRPSTSTARTPAICGSAIAPTSSSSTPTGSIRHWMPMPKSRWNSTVDHLGW